MAERQLKPAETAFHCAYCRRPFADRSNHRRHVLRAHAGAATRNLVVTQPPSSTTGSTLTLRHTVTDITEHVLRSNFTRSSGELLSTIRMLEPSLSSRVSPLPEPSSTQQIYCIFTRLNVRNFTKLYGRMMQLFGVNAFSLLAVLVRWLLLTT